MRTFILSVITSARLSIFIVTDNLLFPRRTSTFTGHKVQLALVFTV
jgi:hypothetical protein